MAASVYSGLGLFDWIEKAIPFRWRKTCEGSVDVLSFSFVYCCCHLAQFTEIFDFLPLRNNYL